MSGPHNELEKKAEAIESQSKIEFNKKNFQSTVVLLEEAKAIYSELGFQGKIGMLNQRIARIKNVMKLEEQGSSERTKSEQNFQNRVKEVLDEKNKSQDKQLAQQKMVSPEIRNKLEKVKMIIEKAEKEEKLGKYPRVIRRYEFILELYQSIPKDTMDLSNDIAEVEKKLSVLRTKM